MISEKTEPKSWLSYGYKRLSDAGATLDGTDIDEDPLQRCSVIRVPFRNLARATVSLPLGGFIFIVLWAMFTDLESATYTHCGVKNYLPSLSAAMGGFSLSQTVWRIAIALHAAPRFIVTGMYYKYLKSILFGRHVVWAAAACILNVLENLGLIGLTYVSSKENYRIHEKCFIVFMVCSELYMVIMCLLLLRCRNIPATSLESKSLRVKIMLVLTNLVSFALAGYTFVRHNAYCEEGMYTIFAFLEYIVVLTNMAFHMTAFWDFYDKIITIGNPCGLGLKLRSMQYATAVFNLHPKPSVLGGLKRQMYPFPLCSFISKEC